MRSSRTVFSQLLEFIPRKTFERCVAKYNVTHHGTRQGDIVELRWIAVPVRETLYLQSFSKDKPIEITTRLLTKQEYPWPLLLEADPSRTQVEKYLPCAEVFGLFDSEILIGVLVLTPKEQSTYEIANIAISPEHRGKGFGRRLLLEAIIIASNRMGTALEIGTGNSSLGQLYLYQSVGFRIVGIEKDYFPNHYPQPILENGLKCVDMIRLSLDLKNGYNQS
jgi:ribosomal protein S18 acetylase RimI-like enzyme